MNNDGKKLVFVSVPMSGKDDAIVERHIQVTKARYLRETKKNVKDVAFYDNLKGCRGVQFPNLDRPNLGYLSRAILKLGRCDEAIFGTGWEQARGCKVEHLVCELYGIPIRQYEE